MILLIVSIIVLNINYNVFNVTNVSINHFNFEKNSFNYQRAVAEKCAERMQDARITVKERNVNVLADSMEMVLPVQVSEL